MASDSSQLKQVLVPFALTLPTAASPSNTSLTLLLGFGADAFVESVIEGENVRAL